MKIKINIPLLNEKIYSICLNVFCFLFPLFYLPVSNPSLTAKNSFLIISTLVLLIIYLLKSLITNKNHIFFSPNFSLPVIMLAVSYLISTFLNSYIFPSLMTSLAVVSLVIIFHLILGYENKKSIALSLLLSGLAATIILLIGILDKPLNLGLTPTRPVAPISDSSLYSMQKDQSIFSPLGSLFFLFLFLTGLSPIAIIGLSKFTQGKKSLISATKAAIALIVLIGAFLSTVEVMPPLVGRNPNTPILLDFGNSLKIASKSLSSGFKNAAVGFGPENFVNAFNLLKPKSLNDTELWVYRFTSSNTYFLQLISTLGLLGTLSYFILVAKVFFYLGNAKGRKNPYFFTAVLITCMNFVVPYSIVLLFLLFVSLAMSEEQASKIKTGFLMSFSALTIGIVVLVISFKLLSNVVEADGLYFKSTKVQPPVAKTILDYQRKASELNPYYSDYFTYLSQNSYLVGTTLSQKENSTPDEQKLAQSYIEQSIDYLNKAIAVDPDMALNYSLIASVYRNNYDKIQNADNLSIENYEKAISLDPTNPRTYVDFGALYYRLKNFKKAEDLYKQAIDMKSDYTNAYYNLAYALSQQKKYQEALVAIEKVLSLVPPNTPDFEKATKDKELLTKSLTPTPAEKPKLAEIIDAGIASDSGRQKKILKINTEELLKIATESGTGNSN